MSVLEPCLHDLVPARVLESAEYLWRKKSILSPCFLDAVNDELISWYLSYFLSRESDQQILTSVKLKISLVGGEGRDWGGGIHHTIAPLPPPGYSEVSVHKVLRNTTANFDINRVTWKTHLKINEAGNPLLKSHGQILIEKNRRTFIIVFNALPNGGRTGHGDCIFFVAYLLVDNLLFPC